MHPPQLHRITQVIDEEENAFIFITITLIVMENTYVLLHVRKWRFIRDSRFEIRVRAMAVLMLMLVVSKSGALLV